MRPAVLFAFVLAGGLSLNAQVTAVLNRFPDRSPEVEIRNNSTLDLTAFAFSMNPVASNAPDRDQFVFFADTVLDMDRAAVAGPLPLPPNQKYTAPVNSGFRAGRVIDLYEPPIVTAAVFADGTTAGDPDLLSRLIRRRGSMLQAVELSREILSNAGQRNVPRNQLIGQFRMLAESAGHWYLPPEQRVSRGLYQSISDELVHLPELPIGSAFPPTAFVEQETATLNRQRIRLLNSRPPLAEVAVARK